MGKKEHESDECGNEYKLKDPDRNEHQDRPFKFLQLLLDADNHQVTINDIKKEFPFWKQRKYDQEKIISRLNGWKQHFIKNIVDGKRYWLTIDEIKDTCTLHFISLYVPENWHNIDPNNYTANYYRKCFDEDGNPNDALLKKLGIKTQKEKKMNTIHNWVPFFKEMVGKMLEKHEKNPNEDFLKPILEEILGTTNVLLAHDNWKDKKIDPFSFIYT